MSHASKAASSTVTTTPDQDAHTRHQEEQKRYERLACRVIKESVVPFLGAGFSYGASAPSGFDTRPGDLVKKLAGHLEKTLARHPCDSSSEECTLRSEFAKAKHSESLGHLAEIMDQLEGPRALCELLRIADFATFRPRPSHRYMAYLAREGLIREIITTNYDTCLETAFRESLDDPAQVDKRHAVITCLEKYRAEAARHIPAGHLLIFKINGCALEYRNSKNPCNRGSAEEAARRIILTERRMQNFRNERWAQDLLQDRARTRNLLFSGFGNDEPQIRHSVLTLLEEFESQNRILRPDEAMSLPNAPFMQIYEHALSFNQSQLLVGFLDAHSDPVRLVDDPGARIRPVFRNVFNGTAAEYLDASEFMHKLFDATFRGLVFKATEPDQEMAFWLRAYTREWRSWLARVRALLPDVESGAQAARDPNKYKPDPDTIQLADRLLGGSGEPGEQIKPDAMLFPVPLWRVLYAMRFPTHFADLGNTRPRFPSDFYISLREHPVLVLITLLLVCGCDGEDKMSVKKRLSNGGIFDHPFDISVKGTGNTAIAKPAIPFSFRLIEDTAIQNLFENDPPRSRSRLLRFVSIPSRADPFVLEGRWQAIGSKAGRLSSLKTGRVIIVPVSKIIKKAREPDNVAAAMEETFLTTPFSRFARLTRLSAPSRNGSAPSVGIV